MVVWKTTDADLANMTKEELRRALYDTDDAVYRGPIAGVLNADRAWVTFRDEYVKRTAPGRRPVGIDEVLAATLN